MAAYKTVELDESLGGGPVQHREVMTKTIILSNLIKFNYLLSHIKRIDIVIID